MSEPTDNPQLIHNALRSLPAATFVLTCCHDRFRDGIITQWVQQCCTEPPMLVVSLCKGQQIEPMLRDARAFALCKVNKSDRRITRLFGREHDKDDDPFLSIETQTSLTGMPILKNSKTWFDCKLEGHLSPDADCRLYLGRVVAVKFEPSVGKKSKDTAIIQPPTNVQRKKNKTSISTVAKYKP
ncbi:MAG: flavin reductase family protein [Phycisphaerales bacterium]|nr:flavin reductase family protein [Phycisphaerales bacterium]